MADILKHKLDDPDLRHLAETIRESGDQLLSIVTDMLEYAQVEAGGPDHERAPFDPADVVRQVAARYRKAATAKGLALVTRCEATSRIGDPRRIAEMIARLVSNAIKFTHSGSVTLRVTAAETGATVFEVSDTGVGMTAD